MTNTELIELLREARSHSLAGATCVCEMCGDLLSRIDAALAAHDAEERIDSATPVVEWEKRQGDYIHDDGVKELRVYLWGDEWHWSTVVEYRANGTCTTEAEAKAAAIAAAKGMK